MADTKDRGVTMPEITDQYAAAAIDLRGRLQTNVGGTQRNYRPGLSVTSVEREIVEALRDHFDLGAVTSFFSTKLPDLEIFAWNVRGPAAIKVLERVTPHMVGSLKEHAQFILTCEYSRPTKAYKEPARNSA